MWWLWAFVAPWALAMTPEQVLQTAWSEGTYTSQDQLRPTDSRNPIRNVEAFVAEKMDGKTETEVGVKLQFRSWPEWKMGRDAKGQQKILKESALAWALYDRYVALLNYEMNRQKIKAMEESLKTTERYLKAQTLSLKAGKSSAKAYLSAKETVFKMKRQQGVAEQQMDLAKNKIKVWSPDWAGDSVKEFDLITVDDIQRFLSASSPKEQSLSNKLAVEEFKELEHEYTIVRGRERQWIKGLELSQKQEKDENKFKIELSIQIPGLGSDDLLRQKQNELILKKALKQKEISDAKDRLIVLKNQILNLVGLYKFEEAEFRLTTKSHSLDSLSNSETRIASEQEQIGLLNQQQEITMLYLEYLLESEELLSKPDINYLSHQTKRIL